MGGVSANPYSILLEELNLGKTDGIHRIHRTLRIVFFVAVLGKGIWKKEAEERTGQFEARAAELLGGRFFHEAIGITGKVLGSCSAGGNE